MSIFYDSWSGGSPRRGRGRRVRRLSALGAVVALLAVAGCSSSTGRSSAGSGATGSPVRGGILTIGVSGGAASDTLDPHTGTTNPDYNRLPQLYDVLVKLSHDGKTISNRLAKSMTPNADGTRWTIKVRSNAKCSDGSDFTSRDVLWNLKRILDGNLQGAVPLGPIDLAGTKATDAKTLVVAYKSPFAIFKDVLAGLPFYYMACHTWTKDHVVGTGPFKLVSFQPGVSSVVTRFDQYWQPGKPYLDKITTLDLADETTQVNALSSGQVDAIDFLSSQSIRQVQAQNFNVIISKTRGWAPITMATDAEPFKSNLVRQAMRLLIDRDQINQNVYGGYGTVANDIFGVPDDPTGGLPQRQRDVAKAKSLLAQAGASNLSLTLITNDVVPAQRAVAALFAEQAKEGGVNIKVEFQAATTFFAQSYLKVPFSQDYWYYVPYLANVAGATTSTAPFNATHYHNPHYDALFNKAIATVDPTAREAIIKQMQKIDYEDGGNIIPVFYPVVDAANQKVGGLVPDVSGFPFGNNSFEDVWLKK